MMSAASFSSQARCFEDRGPASWAAAEDANMARARMKAAGWKNIFSIVHFPQNFKRKPKSRSTPVKSRTALRTEPGPEGGELRTADHENAPSLTK